MSALVELDDFSTHEVSGLKAELTIKLQTLRYQTGVPIHVTSGLRVGDTGAHGVGHAVDISDNSSGEDISSRWRFLVLKAAFALGFSRIGIYDKHIHLDISKSLDQDVAWWSTSD